MLAKQSEISILFQTQNQMVQVLFESMNKKCFGFSRTTKQFLHVDFYALHYSAACCSILSYKTRVSLDLTYLSKYMHAMAAGQADYFLLSNNTLHCDKIYSTASPNDFTWILSTCI